MRTTAAGQGDGLDGLRIRWEGPTCVVHLGGELDASKSDAVADVLDAVIGGGRVVVDLSEVTFADWRGLRPLVVAANEAAERGGTLTIRHVPPSVDLLMTVVPALRRLVSG